MVIKRMFKNDSKKKDDKVQNVPETKEEYIPKWDQPKILLVDMEQEAEIALRREGYNVLSGSFGRRYKVPKNDNLAPLVFNGFRLPNYSEQEIIVVDLEATEAADKPEAEKGTSDGQDDWWASCSDGILDPRPRAMFTIRNDFDRILQHDGIYIIFADMRCHQDLRWGHVAYRQFHEESKIDGADNWCFLSILNSNNIEIVSDSGYEMSVTENQSPIGRLLQEHLKGGSFSCSMRRTLSTGINKDKWITLANNKYGHPVSCAITTKNDKGWIFIFPRLQNIPLFISGL